MFLGHKNDIHKNEWTVFPYLKDWALSNLDETFCLVSNVCPHQGSYLSGDRGRNTRSCSYHGWSFKIDGSPLGSGTTSSTCQNLKSLDKKEVFEWNGFLFSEEHDLPSISVSTTNLELVGRRTVNLDCNPIHVMDLFLDVNHIPILHKGVYEQINTPSVDKIKWVLGKNTASQLVPIEHEETEFYKTLLENDKKGSYGAGWFAVYPNTMIEWQPGAWFITVINSCEGKTSIEVFKYRDTRYSEQNWNINDDVWETAFSQDCKQASRMKKDYLLTDNLEVEKLHFRSCLR
jgi:phenylpropionate dioxygenase-like ring-hydroxylating dioxygenase large terminal subunit